LNTAAIWCVVNQKTVFSSGCGAPTDTQRSTERFLFSCFFDMKKDGDVLQVGGSEKTACANGCENVVCRTQRHVQLFLYIGSAPISHKVRSVTVHLRLNRFPAAPPRRRTQKSQGKANGYC